MKNIFLFLFIFCSFFLNAQYPSAGTKIRLGWQTTGDGLVWRGSLSDTSTIDPSTVNNAWILIDTVNGTMYAYRQKAWRLVSGGGGVSMPFDSVTFNINEGDASEQELKYSAEKGYLQYGGLDSVQIPLLPGIWYVRNDDSVTVSKGMVVRASGTLGASGRIKVKRMIADGTIAAMYVLGIAMHDIAVGADGYVMTQGKIRQVNTTAYSEGAVLYADVDTLGGLTQTEPGNGYLKLPIAFVVHSASNGVLAVRVNPGLYLRDLHDVDTTGRVGGSVLQYNDTLKYWKASTTAGIVAGDTSVFVRQYQLSGNTGYLPKYTTDTTLGNSPLYNPSGNKILIGTTTGNILSNNLELHSAGAGSIFQPAIEAYMYNNFAANYTPYFSLYRSRDTIVNGKTRINQGDWLGRLTFEGADSLKYVRGAQIYALTDDTVKTDKMPTALRFATNSGATSQPTDRMSITSAGRVGIGTTSPGYPLHVNGTSYATTVITNGNFVGNGQLTTTDPRSGLVSIGPSSNTVPQYFMGGYGTFYGAGHTTKPGNIEFGVGQNTTGKIIFYTDNFGQNQTMTLTNNSFVGINTSSPSRPLHVAGTSAIRIPVGTTGQRPSPGADGDIRYNTTNTNFEWHNGTEWRQPVNAARSPAAGLANRFSKFNADGLLDTSAVLTQSNGRIGIGVASPTEALQVNGTARATRLAVNTFGSQVSGMNNYAPVGSFGYNLWIGDGGQKSLYTSAGDGSFNVSLGAGALFNNTRGNSNVAIGQNSLAANTIGEQNLAIGAAAMRYNTIGGYNVALGSNVLASNVSGASNVAIGQNTLYSNVSGNQNLAIGGGTMVYNTTGSYNVAMGTSALLSNISGTFNTAIGQSSLEQNTYGTDNLAVGGNALKQNTIGSFNTALGASAIGKNTTGVFNVALGFSAGELANAGGNNQTSSSSVYIGYDTRSSVSGNTNEIVIGTQARGNGSNTTTIGNSSTTHTVFEYGETLLGYSAAQDKGAFRLQVDGEGYISTGFRVDYLAAFDANTIFQMPNTSTKGAKGYAWNTYSDARIKTSVGNIENALEKTMALRPVRYLQSDSYVENGQIKVSDTGRNTIGFIAQEVEPIVPEAVQRGSDTELWGMDYTKLIPMLTKAIQEQQAQIEALKKEIEQLKNK